MGLTDQRIEKLMKPGLHADEKTLYLKISKNGSRSWVQRIMIDGKRHDVGLGSWPIVPVTEARGKALENRSKIYRGEGIRLRTRKQEKVGATCPTLREAARAVILLNAGEWKAGGKTRQSWEQTLEDYVFSYFKDKDPLVSDITPSEVFDMIAPLWTTKHHQALKVRQRLGLIMKWAQLKEYRPDNPVDAVQRGAGLPRAKRQKKNFRAIPYQKLRTALDVIRKSTSYPTTILCLEFQVMTATRPSEARLAEWQEINLDEKTWTIPASRMKTEIEFRVPLSSGAIAILEQAKLYKEPDLNVVFPSARGGTLSDSTVSKVCRQNNIAGVPHTLARACFRSWAANQQIPREQAEACLAHTVKDHNGAYLRDDLYDLRIPIMENWSDYLHG